MRESRRWVAVLLTVLGVALLVVAGAVVASSATIFEIPLLGGGQPGSNAGYNFVCLPEILDQNPTYVRDIFRDMLAQNVPVQIVAKHRKSDDVFDIYTWGGGTIPPKGWELVAGEGYIVKVDAGFDGSYFVNGENDPLLQVPIVGAGPDSNSGVNFICVPSAWSSAELGPPLPTAKALFRDLNDPAPPAPADTVQFLFKHRPVDDLFEVYTYGGGTIPPEGWPIVAGEAYLVKANGGTFLWP